MDAEELAADAARWLLDRGRPDGAGGLAWSPAPGDPEPDPYLYHGGAGVVLALLEAYRHLGDGRYADAAARGARPLAATVEEPPGGGAGPWSLYVGLAGVSVALHAAGTLLAEPDLVAAARRGLDRVRAAQDGGRWGAYAELYAGNAGVALGALRLGDAGLALAAATPYLDTADETPGGVNWAVRPAPARSHHVAHGTLGIVLALAATGAATGRDDLVDLARRGAEDVVARDVAGPDGFLVPHSDPPHRPELIERWSYGWCNGPAGDAQAFRWLGRVTGDPRWARLADRCWSTVTRSGLPVRLRPGFWDNHGRCCGTAGVLALACDRAVEHPEPDARAGARAFADLLVRDHARHAIRDAAGARWSNLEHRATRRDLPPRTGWAMGSAGIVRELLRYARLTAGRDPAYAVDWPDQAPAVPAITGTGAGNEGGNRPRSLLP